MGFYLNVKTKLIRTEGTRLLREKRVQGRPRRREASRADRPRKASAWSGNQRSSFTNKKTTANMEFYLNFKTKVIGTEGARLLRENASKGDSAGASRGRTARGKRVPGVEINVRVLQTKKTAGKLAFLRVCLQSETAISGLMSS
ncbi:hypothetical protein [Peribacillus simplex]|uniref:hypothetical protein n=1 Tax=Peribacillus simplex TaxID=1478 RepID=UPI003D2D0278